MGIEKKLISKKKPFYPISKKLENFLKKYDRWINNVISYDDLLRYSDSINIYDKNDKDTLWVRLIYNENERNEIDENLKIIYTLLHSDGNPTSITCVGCRKSSSLPCGNIAVEGNWDSKMAHTQCVGGNTCSLAWEIKGISSTVKHIPTHCFENKSNIHNQIVNNNRKKYLIN